MRLLTATGLAGLALALLGGGAAAWTGAPGPDGRPGAAAVQAAAGQQAAAPDTTLPPLTVDEQEAFLKEAKIVGSSPIGKGVTKPWRLTLQHGGRTHAAAFQSVDRSKTDARFRSGRRERLFRDFYGYNIAAYRLARALGYDDLVPAAVERQWRGQHGALTWWIEKKWDEDERLKAGIAPPDLLAWERQVYLARAFTALVEDTDRNLGNQLVTADFHLWMIDFTRAFRYALEIDKTATLRKVDRRFFDRLRTVPDETISAAVSRWLDKHAMGALLARRRALVAHFTAIIAERGESVVLID
jgi:hypothetical protein